MTIYFGRPEVVRNVSDAILRYGDKEFESPTRSTVPLLSLLIHAPSVFNDIVTALRMPEKHDLFLEYTVSPRGGRGKASHTDVMIKSGSAALAIEAKWTEPMYDTVRKWLGGETDSNRNRALNGWLEMLADRVGENLSAAQFSDSIYQMVHRAASAADSGEQPRLAYFLFKCSGVNNAATTDQIVAQLRSLWFKLGKPANFPFSVVELDIVPTQAFDEIMGLPKNLSSTAEAVVAALLGETPLFQFGTPRILLIGESL
jgi:hypothetical protein